MTRFDQRLERGFDGNIDEEGALAVGEFELVSLTRLTQEIAKGRAELGTAGSLMDLDLKNASDMLALLVDVEFMEEEVGRRNATAA